MRVTTSPLRALLSVRLVLSVLVLCLTSLSAIAALPNHSIEMLPMPAGPYPVACSNIAQDSARVAALGVPIDDFWNGTDGRYIGDILLEPAETLVVRPRVPDDELYPARRNTTVEFVVIACYPTEFSNVRPDYLLPNGQRVPRMQRLGQSPVIASQPCAAIFPPPPNCGRFPLMVFSHGLAGNPIDGKSIDFLVRMASYGYIVAAPFHGDKRFSRVKIDDIEDIFYIILNFDRIVELQALRPVSIKAVIDLMLANPQFSSVIDAARIGGIGGSMGGATMTWLLGAELTNGYPSLRSRPTVQDARIKAAVGYVPYAGQSFLPAFGDDNATAKNVSTPYLAISGTADTSAPIKLMEQAMNNFRGARYQVALAGIQHTYEPAYADDVFGWAIPFFDAYLNGNLASLDRLTRQRNVRGGLDDSLRIDYTPPRPLAAGEVLIDEFYFGPIRRFFITSRDADKAFVERVYFPLGASRSGYFFKGYALPGQSELRPATQVPVCRYFLRPLLTHFYSADAAECQYVRSLGANDEGFEFWTNRATVTACPAGTHAVTRLYNNRWRESDSTHRYTTSTSVVRAMVSEGWIDEGAVMCAPL